MKIKISAKLGEGKATMAAGIANFLRGLGFNDVRLIDPDGFPEEEITQRLKARAAVSSVEITTEQLPRDFPAKPPAPENPAVVTRRATIHPFTRGKVISEHEIGPYQIVEYHPYKSGGTPVDERGRRLPREVEAHTLFHVYFDGEDTNQSTQTLEGAMLVAISHKKLGRHAPGLAMLCRALKLDEEGC